jgi:hypothetical protein
VYVCTCVRVYVCTCVRVRVYVYVYVYVQKRSSILGSTTTKALVSPVVHAPAQRIDDGSVSVSHHSCVCLVPPRHLCPLVTRTVVCSRGCADDSDIAVRGAPGFKWWPLTMRPSHSFSSYVCMQMPSVPLCFLCTPTSSLLPTPSSLLPLRRFRYCD